jgi:N-acetylmuramoyl-L-alanine amidase
MQLIQRAVLLAFLLLTGCIWNYAAFAADAKKPVILLDPGHNPPTGGAVSIRGISEVIYNDRFTAKLTEALQKAGFRVELTRAPHQSISLDERSALANSLKADLFLSIHHDSAQLVHLDKISINGTTAYRTKERISGYSIFVSRRNAQFDRSWLFAQRLGKHLLKLGRPPTMHHAENIPGENRELLDERLGIYRFDELSVLRKTEIPAVLLEIGVIVDEEDEAYVRNPKNQEMMVRSIVDAIKDTINFNFNG